MNNDHSIRTTTLGVIAGIACSSSLAQEAPPVEEVIVTGTLILRESQFDVTVPLETISREDFDALGVNEFSDIIEDLTINTGSQNNPDSFTQNFSAGTSNVNLRGLGVGSTLVLINGRRQTQSAVATDRGETFVDTSSLPPMIAFDRIEVLKDGATSLYGSDAVAGVVNFLTRDNFEGVEFELSRQGADAYPQNDLQISGLFGGGNDRTHVLIAGNILSRDPLTTFDRRLSGPADDLSQAGNPGSFLVPALPGNPIYAPIWTAAFDGNLNGVADGVEPQLGLPPVPGASLPVFADPDCAAIAAQSPQAVPTFEAVVPTPAGDVPIGLCQFDFGEYFSIVPEEERAAAFLKIDHIFNDTLTGQVEWHYADNEAIRNNSPSFPFARFPTVPAAHPDNPFGTDASFIGRIRGAGGTAVPSVHSSALRRFAANLEGDINDNWRFDVGFTVSENDFTVVTTDVLIDRFNFAIQGLGGAGCDPDSGAPGVGPCDYFNPFGSALTGSGTQNSNALFDDIIGDFRFDATSELKTVDAVVVGQVGELSGGPVGLAIGAQIRDDKLAYDYDENSNSDNFLFFAGTPDFGGSRDVSSVFAELALPVSDTLELQLAARFEDYGGGVDSTDPKISFLYRPTEQLSLRGSFGTSFRAPSLFQEVGVQTSLAQLTDPTVGIAQFFPVRTAANPDAGPLQPEEADVVNLGFSWSPNERWELGIDYWSFDYNQVIIQQNPQALLNAAFAGDPEAQAQVLRDPTSGLLLRVDSFYANASALETSGLDLAVSYDVDAGGGILTLGADATLMTDYDLDDPQAGRIDGLGNRNFTNFATSAPELRANLFARWQREAHAINVFFRHIDSYIDDQAVDGDVRTIDSLLTVDAQYSYSWPGDYGLTASFGAINLTDEDPPSVRTNGGYDSKVHDPRGRLIYARINFSF
ncbi:MAG: TonB-dependent receptor plug domain-containing protein [Gammaproteobacteria bacterium]